MTDFVTLERARRKRIFLIMGLVVVVIGLAAGFLAKPAYREFKYWRAKQLAEGARELMQDTKTLQEAWEQAQAAHELAPDRSLIVRTLAEIYERVDAERAFPFWEQAVALSDGDAGDRKALARVALVTERILIAREQLNALASADFRDVETLRLRAQLLTKEGKIEEAVKVAREAVGLDPDSPDTHFLYLNLSQISRNPETQAAGLTHLWSLSERSDEVGLHALRNLALNSNLKTEEARSVVERLESHPLAKQKGRLLALELKLRFGTERFKAVIDEAKSLFALHKPEDLATLGRWFNSQRLYRETIELIGPETARSRQDVFLVRLDALAILERWREIEQVLEEPRIPLQEHIRHLFEMRAFLKLGEARRAGIAWDRSLLAAGRDAERLWYAADYTSRLRLDENTREALERLIEIPSAMRKAFERLLQLNQKRGETEGVRDVYARMITVYPKEPAVVNDLAYLNLLLNQEIEESLSSARRMVDENPLYLAHRITLAFAYWRLGDAKAALNVFEGLTLDWSTAQTRHRVVFSTILKANGYEQEATTILQGIDPEFLLPEERELFQEVVRS